MRTQRKSQNTIMAILGALLLLFLFGTNSCLASGTDNENYLPGWYMISNQNQNGIALRDTPSTSGNLIKRFTYGTRFYVNSVYGHWGSTTIDGYSGWIHLGYSTYLGDNPSAVPAPSNSSSVQNEYASGVQDYLTCGTGYYTITTTYKPGIALHPAPDHSSDILIRVPDGTPLYVNEIVENYGFTTYAGYSGWINLDYAVFSGYGDGSAGSLETGSGSGSTTAGFSYKEIYEPILINGYDPQNAYGEYEDFALLDIDNDGVKELIADSYQHHTVVIYTIENNSPVKLLEYSGMVRQDYGEPFVQYNDEYQALILFKHGGTGMRTYDMIRKSGNNLEIIGSVNSYSEVSGSTFVKQIYGIDGYEVTEDEWQNELNSKYECAQQITLVENTDVNRQNYL